MFRDSDPIPVREDEYEIVSRIIDPDGSSPPVALTILRAGSLELACAIANAVQLRDARWEHPWNAIVVQVETHRPCSILGDGMFATDRTWGECHYVRTDNVDPALHARYVARQDERAKARAEREARFKRATNDFSDKLGRTLA